MGQMGAAISSAATVDGSLLAMYGGVPCCDDCLFVSAIEVLAGPASHLGVRAK